MNIFRTLLCLMLLLPAGHLAFAAAPPADRVLVEICENGVPTNNQWPAAQLSVTESYTSSAFGLFRVPHRYIDTGIRADRPNPYLLRASATVFLPAGSHRLLLRGRGAARLSIDGRRLLTTSFRPPITDGHNPIRTNYLDLGPDFRFAPPGNSETWTTFTSPGKAHEIVLETIVGGRRGKGILRPELGETVVAVSLEGTTSFRLLAPRRVIPYTDEGWKAYAAAESARLAELDAQRRQQARQKHAATWQKRREIARRWLESTPEPRVPALPKGYPAFNAIDHFLAVQMAGASEPGPVRAGSGTIDFHKSIKPVLQARCYSCHQGKKVRGGLRLDSRSALLAGGDSGQPAIVPGQPGKSSLLARIKSSNRQERMPPRGDRLTDREVALLAKWIEEGASWRGAGSVSDGRGALTELTDDRTFLRRVTLDTVGVIPTPDEIEAFLSDRRPNRRALAIDRLLDDPRWADHWVGYWQDVLAENPNILNPTLNNTGPFRWWIHESLLDRKPFDMFVTELVQMRGSLHQGGPAGFAMASQNDVPMAEKALILSSAFLGVPMKCARCHDSPSHRSTQKDLFGLAAMLAEKPLKVPATSSVPKDKLHNQGRKSLISVTLRPGTVVRPAWPFAELAGEKDATAWLPKNASPRDRLAALLTAPSNERFAQVMVNRVWKRLMGRGLVEPVDDWEKGESTHPELLRYLAREFVRSGYDVTHISRLILNSHAYQRQVNGDLKEPDPLYTAPAHRRLTAEQIVDSLFLAAGKAMNTEEINLDVDAGRDMKNSISLGKPTRAWQFASTSNERDRPSLSLPRVQAVVDVLQAFGWRAARQDPSSERDTTPNVLQPAILANSPVATWLTRLSDDHGITRLALEQQPVETLVDRLFVRVLTRKPTAEERSALVEYLRPGYDRRIVTSPPKKAARVRKPPRYVSWSNHLTEEANEIKKELEAAARRGDPPTSRLEATWRQRMEDALWSLLNAPEFVFTP